jgi:hypothetical protein
MDAYHRSNGGGLAEYFGAGLTGQFDSYGHKVSSDQRFQDNYGFRAESYQHQGGKVAIAYRGTDIFKSTPIHTAMA